MSIPLNIMRLLHDLNLENRHNCGDPRFLVCGQFW
jgi:hypothetical protein